VSVLIDVALLLTAVAGTAVVVTREPAHQAIVLSVFGLVLAILFVVLQAPDVGLSQLVVGAAVLPLMVLLALAKVRDQEHK
jgi:uncharacterized MnhB-related membrane protein